LLRVSKQYWVEKAALAAAAFGTARGLVDEAASTALGLNRTDLRILAVLHAAPEPSTAGALAGEVGLSPAATTEAVQRLVGRGLLTREVDPADRRRAVIGVSAHGGATMESVYGPLAAEGHAIMADYSVAELELITAFLDRGRRFQMAQAERIRGLQALP
jgi:DNA-binding MarR family transcriptional regulator